MTMDVNFGANVPATKRLEGLHVYRFGVKRALDVLLVVLSLPVAAVLVAFCALLVALDGSNPFYTQLRVGRGGRCFRLLKLRTMVPDADARLAEYLAEHADARAEWDAFQKLRNDPRITPIGRLLRATSLDELPQLWNVLCGDMSLVGPRPMMPSQKSAYAGTAYYRLRPGLTGAWQVSARNASTFADRAQFDQAYDHDLSLWTDLSILAATPAVVLRATGQ